MFRTDNCSSSGGVLYKQLTVSHHAEIILKLYLLYKIYNILYTVTIYYITYM
jgi:hypothetical protein